MAEEQADKPDGMSGSAFVERLHDLAVRTQNPVYAWLALEHLLAPSAGLGKAPATPATLPPWLVAYLHDAAVRLSCLSAGVDFRKDLPPLDLGLFVTDGEPWPLSEILQSPELKAHTDAQSIDTVAAMKVVPHALGLIQQNTKNMFREFQSATEVMQEAAFYEAVTKEGILSKVATGAIADGSSGSKGQSERQILERISQGRKLLEHK